MNNGSYLLNFLRNKWVILIIVCDLIALITIIVMTINTARQSAILVLDITPLSSTVSIDGQGSYQNGTYKITPGNHQLTISNPDMTPKTLIVNFEDQYTTTVSTFLSQNGNFDFYKQKQNYDSFVKLSDIASSEHNTTIDQDITAENFITKYQQAYDGIREYLPIKQTIYFTDDDGEESFVDITINSSYATDCETWLCLSATMRGANAEDLVQDLIKDKGLKVEDYEIKYQVY